MSHWNSVLLALCEGNLVGAEAIEYTMIIHKETTQDTLSREYTFLAE